MGLEDGVPWKQHLWRALVAPLEEELQRRQAKHLVLVPDFALNFVPMHQLEGPRGALGDSYQISYAPNLSVVAAAVARPTAVPPPPSITVVCAPPGVFRYGGAELTAIRQVAPCAVRVPPGESVSESELREALAQSSIVHFATHGRFDDREPERSGLMLNRDRWLTLDKIRELVLPGSLVYLSACDTARLRLVSRERALGVAESMLFAGASTAYGSRSDDECLRQAHDLSRLHQQWA